ncbi:MAG: hypothetical protein ACFFED_13335 [Candidatus Thorarchaeota archaeon]
MANQNWTNKWILMYMAGLIIQAIIYTVIAFTKPADFASHLYFFDVAIIAFGSIIFQAIGFGIIMKKTKDMAEKEKFIMLDPEK